MASTSGGGKQKLVWFVYVDWRVGNPEMLRVTKANALYGHFSGKFSTRQKARDFLRNLKNSNSPFQITRVDTYPVREDAT